MTTGGSGRGQRRNPWKWIGAFSAAAALHAGWFYALDFQWPSPAPVDANPPPLRALLGKDELAIAAWFDANEWRCPAGFAQPRDYGFSRLLLQERVPMRPPVDRPPAVALTWPRPSAAERRAPPVIDLKTVAYWQQPLEWPAASGSQPGPIALADESPLPRINRIEPEPGRLIEQLAWPDDSRTWGGAPWIAVLALRINEHGVVTEALLDRRTDDPEVNQRLLQSALRWRWAVGKTRDWVRVEVEYAGTLPRRHNEEYP